jgi:hypothetical protein
MSHHANQCEIRRNKCNIFSTNSIEQHHIIKRYVTNDYDDDDSFNVCMC